MSLFDEIEDEDVTIQNSPLDQYLNNIDFNDTRVYNLIDNDNKNAASHQLKFLILHIISNIIYKIKRYMWSENVEFLMKKAQSLNILDEEDEICLKYLMDTKDIQLNENIEKFQFLSKWKIATLFFVSFFFLMFFDTKHFFLSILFLFFAWLLSLVAYKYVSKYLIINLFDKMVTISKQSRQIILMIQELLSINQGYDRLVHIKNDEYYDCSKSFNVTFLQELSRKTHNTLCNLLNESERCNLMLQSHCNENVFCPQEIPWLNENCRISLPDFYSENDFDASHPIGQLKVLHNLIQSQFSFSIKRIVLWIFSFHYHPCFNVPTTLFFSLKYCSSIIIELDKCIRILHFKTKTNLSEKINVKKFTDFDNKRNFICNSLRSMQLHLFELSEFTSQFSEEIQNIKCDEIFLKTKIEAFHKNNAHINALCSCWTALSSEVEDYLRSDTISVDKTKERSLDLKTEEHDQNIDNLIVIDKDCEIIDEVLEGVPLELPDIEYVKNSCNLSADTFMEKSKRNATSLLNELKSVIEVRGEEWRRREKIALERRAAEGKFVFGDEKIGNIGVVLNINKDEDNDSYEERLTESEGCCYNVNDEMSSELRLSLSEMILRQRRTMFTESNIDLIDEECFGD